MKKVVIAFILTVLCVTQVSYGTELKPLSIAPTGVWIKLNINLHRPKFNCERGFGLCFLVSWGFEKPVGTAEKNLCQARGILNERNQLIIEIDEDQLSKYEGGSVLPYFKDKTYIPILDPYEIPEATCRALGSPGSLTIKPGNYPVSYQNNVYRVIFQL
jgi:hypothetical protein